MASTLTTPGEDGVRSVTERANISPSASREAGRLLLSVTQLRTGEQSMTCIGSMPVSGLTGLTFIMSESRREESRAVARVSWEVEV